MLFSEKLHKYFQLARFLPEVAGGADQAGQLCLGNFLKSRRRKQFRLAQIDDGVLHVCPAGILNQDGAHDYFEGGSARPPVLFAVGLKQCVEELAQYGKGFRGRRAGGSGGTARLRGRRFSGVGGTQIVGRTHLSRTITTASGQVKNGTLTRVPIPCSTVQVLANSQRWSKIERRADSVFAMFGVGSIVSRERCGCLSV